MTMGEPAGIGPEIIIAAAAALMPFRRPLVAVGDAGLFALRAARLGREIFRLPSLGAIGAAPADKLAVIDHPLGEEVWPGRPTAANAPAVIAALDFSVDAALKGAAAGLVTAPIQKASLYAAGFPYPGHTEYLAARASRPGAPPHDSLMMIMGGGLKVGLVTIHEPIAKVSGLLTRELIAAKGRILARALSEDFGIAVPRIAVAALNPHAGEGGALGREEIDVIGPAIETLRREGHDARGPLPVDTLFHQGARANYDAVLAMYHDQALIPVKTLDFSGGINVTCGLPLVRTSPDHGTALDLAGTGRADPSSFIAAIKAAAEIADRREARHGGT